jgi:hypothetical protein
MLRGERVNRSWRRWGKRVATGLVVLQTGAAFGQFHHRPKAARPAPSTSMTFIKRDGSCIDGPIAKIAPKVVTVRSQTGPVAIARRDLLQVSQNGSLVYSARSSWADVEAVHLRAPESFELRLHNGRLIKGRPLRVTPDGFVFKKILWLTTRYAKSQIVTVDYLRVKPDSEEFDYFTQTAPALLFFYPEFYDRLRGLEGRIPVRLYDAVRPEDDTALQCSAH